jgi:hypothetical protein
MQPRLVALYSFSGSHARYIFCGMDGGSSFSLFAPWLLGSLLRRESSDLSFRQLMAFYARAETHRSYVWNA